MFWDKGYSEAGAILTTLLLVHFVQICTFCTNLEPGKVIVSNYSGNCDAFCVVQFSSGTLMFTLLGKRFSCKIWCHTCFTLNIVDV